MTNPFGGAKAIVRDRMIELDFLRGIAIIAVMGYHFRSVDPGLAVVSIAQYPFTHFGREGVNLFFTLSGFLVGGLLLKQYAERGAIDARRFIVRRIFKIWPAYYVLIAFHAIVRRHPLDSFLVQNLTHLQNYFGTSISQTWSLAVEEHFYLFLPAVLLVFVRWRLGARAIVAVLGIVCLTVLAMRSLAVADGRLEAAFAYTQYRIDSLLAGVMLAAVYWMAPEAYRQFARRTWLLVALVVGLIAWLGFGTPHYALDESIGYTIQSIGFVALIVLMLEHAAAIRRAWWFRAVAWVGVYSYGIYLWHSIALAPGEAFIATATTAGLPRLVIWAAVLVVQAAIAIGAGYVTTRAVEFPFLRLRNALFPVVREAHVPARETARAPQALPVVAVGVAGVAGAGRAASVAVAPPPIDGRAADGQRAAFVSDVMRSPK
ncbi:acyltransferase family protein [Trinickia acidisoli]|uniref:acyltransferase family protein n=1 Tax=Trinickia acidisoli TaxID=2767482 RepID=UPI001A8E0919|nr:acyltransferase [Trinickia acidisoli]